MKYKIAHLIIANKNNATKKANGFDLMSSQMTSLIKWSHLD